MRYSEREREPYRDNDEDNRTGAYRGNGGRRDEMQRASEIDERERNRSGRARRYRDEDEPREEWPRASSYGNEGPTWLRGQEGPGGYGGTSTFGSVYGSPFNASYNDPWFRERAWRPEEGGRYGQGGYGEERGGRYESRQGRGGWGGNQGGYASREGGYGSQQAYGSQQGYGSHDSGQHGYGSESRHGNQGGYGAAQGGYGGGQGSYGAAQGGYGGGQGSYGGYSSPGQGGYGSGRSGYSGQIYRSQEGYGQRGYGPQGSMGQPSGRHFGRGPKGYQRSDERLREEISDQLMAHPNIDASQVSIEVKSGEVTIEGTVEDRQTKRDVEDLVESVMGVKETNNRLRVQAQSSKWNESESEGSSGQKSGTVSSSGTIGSSSGSNPSSSTSKKS